MAIYFERGFIASLRYAELSVFFDIDLSCVYTDPKLAII
jgi:hypothetical protein